MATGTGNLPNQNMVFTPFDILTAEEQNQLVENIESLADGSGIGDGAVDTQAIADEAVTADKIDFTSLHNATTQSVVVSEPGGTFASYGGVFYKDVSGASWPTTFTEIHYVVLRITGPSETASRQVWTTPIIGNVNGFSGFRIYSPASTNRSTTYEIIGVGIV